MCVCVYVCVCVCVDIGISLLFYLLSFVVQSLSLTVTSWTVTFQASVSFTISWSLLKLVTIESMMPSNNLILYCSVLLLPSIFPSIRVFSSVDCLSGQHFASGSQSTRASAAASVLPINNQD